MSSQPAPVLLWAFAALLSPACAGNAPASDASSEAPDIKNADLGPEGTPSLNDVGEEAPALDVVADACAVGRTLCGARCVDLQRSGTHCGGCDVVCTMGAVCGEGACACLPGRVLCHGTGCTALSFDITNCGNCGTRCAQGQSCTAGECR